MRDVLVQLNQVLPGLNIVRLVVGRNPVDREIRIVRIEGQLNRMPLRCEGSGSTMQEASERLAEHVMKVARLRRVTS
jgi:hypothetical protein